MPAATAQQATRSYLLRRLREVRREDRDQSAPEVSPGGGDCGKRAAGLNDHAHQAAPFQIVAASLNNQNAHAAQALAQKHTLRIETAFNP
eukprot:15467545-Alexandrium_andersonii.AAC.1